MLLKRYILRSISEMFFPFFFVLFFVSSIILLLNIAMLTNGIQLSLKDLVLLYIYGIPANTFFVVALTFYSACILGLSKLSYDSEMLVFFSLGVSPKDIIKMLLPLCGLVSFVLFMFSFVMTPQSKQAYRDFISFKKNEINVNLKPGDFGQKIGDWLVYVDDKKGNMYHGLVLYSISTEQSKDNFILANTGKIENKKGVLELILYDGQAYFKDKEYLQNIKFKEMVVRNFIVASTDSENSLYEYWMDAFRGSSKQLKRFSQSFCTSLFPLVSIFFILFFGIKNPRFHKNYAYFYVLGSGSIYLLSMYLLSMKFPALSLMLPFVWLFAGWYFYKKYIKRFY